MLETHDTQRIAMTVNGEVVEAEVEPRLLLIDFIRQQCRLTGAHIGCEEGVCGACSVEVDGELVKSCLMFAVQADGGSVLTIEGLSENGELHPVQEAFRQEYAIQCGYCTPGMVMAARNLLNTIEQPSVDDIREGMMGNLCRCGNYEHIANAVQAVAAGSVEQGGAR